MAIWLILPREIYKFQSAPILRIKMQSFCHIFGPKFSIAQKEHSAFISESSRIFSSDSTAKLTPFLKELRIRRASLFSCMFAISSAGLFPIPLCGIEDPRLISSIDLSIRFFILSAINSHSASMDSSQQILIFFPLFSPVIPLHGERSCFFSIKLWDASKISRKSWAVVLPQFTRRTWETCFWINEIFEARPWKRKIACFHRLLWKDSGFVVTGQKLKSLFWAVCVLMLIHKYVLVFFLKVQKKVFVFLQTFTSQESYPQM